MRTARPHSLAIAAGTALTLSFVQHATASLTGRLVESRFDLVTGAASPVPGIPAGQAADAAAAGSYVQWFNGAQGQSPALTNVASIDALGNVVYFGKMAILSGGPPGFSPIINSTNQLGIFYAPVADYTAETIIARDGSSTGTPQGGPTPSNPNNWVLNNLSATPGAGLSAGANMSSNGRILITGALRDPVTLANSTSTNNTAIFTGFANSLAEVARRSDAAPGAVSASYGTNLNISPLNNVVNTAGQVFFSSLLVANGGGSDVVTTGLTQNDSGCFVEGPSGNSMVARRGDSPAMLGGAAFGQFTTNPGTNTINANGDVLFGHTLSLTQGAVPATAATDTAIFAKVGNSLQLVAREGGAVTVNGNSETYLSGSQISNGLSSGGQNWNNNGRATFGAKFTPSANITAGQNDVAIMTWQGGTASVAVRTGTTVVPHSLGSGTLADIGTLSNSQTRLNNNNNFTFVATLNTVGGITSANDGGMWLGDATGTNPAQLIVQEGMSAPGFGGATFTGNYFGVMTNNSDMVLFQTSLSSGISSLWGWGPSFGLVNITYVGDTGMLGANYPVGSFNVNGTSNGDGGICGFNDNGDIVLSVSSAGIGGVYGSNAAFVVVHIPSPAAGSLAIFGLGALGIRRRRK